MLQDFFVLFCTLRVASHPAGLSGLIHGNSWGGGDGGGGQEEVSFQMDGREQGEFVPASLQTGKKQNKKNKGINANSFTHLVLKVTPSLRATSYPVGVQCKSVGVLLAEGHAGGAGAPSRAPAEEAAASLTGADCAHLSDGDLTWLPGREPGRRQDMAESDKKAFKQNYETTLKNMSSS